MIPTNATILFQGDSITDCGRQRDQAAPNDAAAMGRGYALLAAGELLAAPDGAERRIFNRGIGGNRIVDLQARWTEDCTELNPDVLSILIGVNDTWRRFGSNPENAIPLDRYEQVYRTILEQTLAARPKVKLLLCEPFVLRCGAVTDAWFPEIDERRSIVRDLAAQFDATFVPFQAAMDEAARHAPAEHWLYDGVHPSVAGHRVLADQWLRSCGMCDS